MKTLSIIIPVYNEEKTLKAVLDKACKVNLGINKEIIIVDDGSRDNSKKIIEDYLGRIKSKNIKFISKENGGKGSAIREGVKISKGDLIIIQDSDLEYDPNEIIKLINFMKRTNFDVVYGSRLLDGRNNYYYFFYYLGNIFLSKLTSLLYSSKITDMETCYKLIPSSIMKSLSLKSKGFEIEPEITAKILKRGYKIGETPINYSPRTKKEGKKINWKDGLKAMFLLIKMRFID